MALRKLASHTLIYGMSSILGRLINWGLTPVYLNHFTEHQNGMISDLYALTFYPLIVLTFGMETSFFHFSHGKLHVDRAYTNSLTSVFALASIFALVGALCYVPLAHALGYYGHEEYILILIGIIWLDTVAALPMAKLRYDERARWFTSISLSNIGLTIVLNVVFVVVFHFGVEFVLIANLVASVVRLLMAFYGNLPRSWKPDLEAWKPMLHYGFFIMLAGLAGTINETFDRNLLPRLWPNGGVYKGVPHTGMEMNGIYGANYKLGMFIALVTQAFRYAAEPFFFKHADGEKSPELFAKIFHYFILACLSVFLIITSFSYEIVSFDFGGVRLFPPQYWVGLEVVPVILLANICLGAYINLSMWYKVTNRVRFGLFIAAIGAFLTILINFLGIPYWGYMACGYATLVCYASMCFLCYYFGKKHYPIP